MKILHVLDHSLPLQSGYTFRTWAILKQQRAFGWETAQVTGAKHGKAPAKEEILEEFRFHRTLPGGELAGQLSAFSQLAVVRSLERRLAEVIQREQPDILHAHSPALNGLAALRAGRCAGLPVVYECRAFWEDAAVDHGTSTRGGIRYRLSRGLETYVFQRADAITVLCGGLRRDILARGVPADKVTIIPNGVDIERFSVGASRPDPVFAHSLGLGKGPVLGFIGSFYAYEGLSLLVRAMPALLRAAPEARLLLVGGGPEAEDLRALAQELGITRQIVFTGRVSHEEVTRYYDLVDIFVYPRLPMRLTELVTPLKPLEAMARGRIVAASKVGGHCELIQEGKTGFLFSPGNPEILAGSLLSIIQRRNDWSEIRKAARRFVEQERTWARSVSGYQQVYDTVIDGHADSEKKPAPITRY
ncbi:Glycosyl transferase, group 1 [Nitrosococcus oceani ATCC 19707]|uniref:Glycosyl transferase, group 1 n=2 Tax=Nitrosococcus oceani TaxID=1229 RepID=Q3J9R1_NITOC|nr:TIGR04063 family PEP-CTERM/XrtA system glycosyltransferase [Nitrosococcus oceani]ABA58435.1 Glycosyl transferase, group 1 [Nitrosococcus oceani ATCC 19707]EDZ67161.1 glycosyl transferase, group 1 family protein [Nitrosococcus oceani AFC27]KFI19149.1 glycosyl transferase family 1 [Nitrosococcus oceani C-27]GEM18829.1 glycosyltransferase WbuB [Nitrosococcus oceani]